MESCDVLIVGGGPSGSSCAWRLRQSGLNVVILDKAQFPRHKVCAGWITPPVIDELKLDVDDYRQQHVIQPITRFLTGLIGGREVETDYHRTVSYGIRRCEFDDYLLRRSAATLRLGETFRAIRRDGPEWIVNDAIRASIVVGAGGHFCPVARYFQGSSKENSAGSPEPPLAHQRQPELPVVLAQEVEFEMTADQVEQCTVEPERPELFFCPDLKGYGWIFRKGNWLNIGLGREGEGHLSAHVNAFADLLHQQGKIPREIPGPFRGHAYRLRTALPRPDVPEGVLLIGDSAGLADRQSGEGIRPAIESGLLAAATIMEVQRSEQAKLAPVLAGKMQARFGATSSTNRLAACIPSSMTQLAARWLMRSHWFTRRVLLDHWFLHAETPLLRV
jgi:flavin-dependent dehydrogenase